MSSRTGFLVPTIRVLPRQHRGEWISPKQLWDWIEGDDPELAGQVRQKVKGYKNPARNNEVWFVSNALSYLDREPGFRAANTEEVPERKSNAYWQIARAE